LTRPAALSNSALVAVSIAAANMALSRLCGKPLVASCACFICLPNNSFNIFAEEPPNRLPKAAVNNEEAEFTEPGELEPDKALVAAAAPVVVVATPVATVAGFEFVLLLLLLLLILLLL